MRPFLCHPARNSNARTACLKLFALPRWAERSETRRQGVVQQRGLGPLPDKEACDRQGGPSNGPSPSPWDVPADLIQKCDRFHPTRQWHPSRDPIPSGRHGRRVAPLQVWLCSLVILVTAPPASSVHPRSPLREPCATSVSQPTTTYPVAHPPSSSSGRLTPWGCTAIAIQLGAIESPVRRRTKTPADFGKVLICVRCQKIDTDHAASRSRTSLPAASVQYAAIWRICHWNCTCIVTSTIGSHATPLVLTLMSGRVQCKQSRRTTSMEHSWNPTAAR